jgi:hypothetical protein
MNTILKDKNLHERDNNITFDSSTHRYLINNEEGYTSVTTWVHKNFEPFNSDEVIDKMMNGSNWSKSKYFGKSKDEIAQEWVNNGKESSSLGVDLHYYIELFMNQDVKKDVVKHSDLLYHYTYCSYSDFKDFAENNPIEWGFFINFVEKNPDLIPYRSEWMVYHDNIKICGTIDMVYENDDGSLTIYDWKRCKSINKYSYGKNSINPKMSNIPDCNYFHYLLQLNLYKFILETKYKKTVKACFLVKLHPNNRSKTYELISLPKLGLNLNNLFTFEP